MSSPEPNAGSTPNKPSYIHVQASFFNDFAGVFKCCNSKDTTETDRHDRRHNVGIQLEADDGFDVEAPAVIMTPSKAREASSSHSSEQTSSQ